MKRFQFVILTFVALAAGLIGGLLSSTAPSPVSAVPEAQRMYGSGVHAWLRSSTRVPLVADQRGSGVIFQALGPSRTPEVTIRGNGVVDFRKPIIVPFGTSAGIVTATPSPTPTPTNTPTATP